MLESYVVDLRSASTIAEGVAALQAMGQAMDLPMAGFMNDTSSPKTPILESGERLSDLLGWPRDFVEHWEKTASTYYSSFFRLCRTSLLPFQWRATMSSSDDKRTERQTKRQFEARGYVAALVVPLHQLRGRVGSVSWWGDLATDEIDQRIDQYGPYLIAAGYYFMNLYNTRHAIDLQDNSAALSLREVECIELAASGLSDADIAEALQLSFHTVRFHITNATHKLKGKNRTHAVAMAAQRGIIGAISSSPSEDDDAYDYDLDYD